VLRSTTAPFTAGKLTRLVAFEHLGDKNTYATTFDDPRVMRLHGGHHGHVDSHGSEEPRPGFFHRAWRAMTGADQDDDASAKHDAHAQQEVATETFWLPQSVDRIQLYCHNASNPDATLTVPLPGHDRHHTNARAFAAQQTSGTAAPEVRTIQNVGPPSKIYNIIFLSAGYREQDKEMFFNNVSNISYLMTDPSLDPDLLQDTDGSVSDMHRTVPFNRYWLGWNVYAVFQPSGDVGANRPLVGLSVDNNLKCTHPAEIERAVYCDRNLAQALAAASPADVMGDPNRNVIVAIVNTAIYGGSAISIPNKLHMGNFFNGFDLNNLDMRQRMLSLTDHELGHAFGDLMDEYSIGVSEPTDRQLSNCEYSSGGPPSAPKWQHWINVKESNSGWKSQYGAGIRDLQDWDVLKVPEAVCGFTNYYKSNSNCMMNRLRDFYMCPVCREGATKSVLKVRFDLEWPRWPLKDVVTIVAPRAAATNETGSLLTVDGQIVLHMATHLRRGYIIKAWDHDGTPLTLLQSSLCHNCVFLNASNFARYPVDQVVKITINITDTTDNFVISPAYDRLAYAQTHQTTYFRLIVASNLTALIATKNASTTAGQTRKVVGTHPSDLQAVYTYCEADNPSLNETLVCSMTFPNRTYERPTDIAGLLEEYDKYVLIGLGVLAVVFLALWAYAATACKDKANAQARSVFQTKHSCFITLVRRVMMFSSVCFLIVSVASIGVSAYFYYKASTLGRLALIAAVILAVVLYLLAFIGFWAVVSRSKRMLVVNGVLLTLAFAVLLAAFIIVIEIGHELQVESSFRINFGEITDNRTIAGVVGGSDANDKNGFWTNQLEKLWIDTVQGDHNTACAIEKMFECSGFYTNCASEFSSTLTCPTQCEETNRKFQSPCQSIFKGYIVDNYSYIAWVTGASAFLLFGGVALNFGLLVAMCCQKKEVQAGHTKRIDGVRGGGAAARNAKLPAAMQKQETDRFKALDLLKSLDTGSTKALVREFKRIDIDGNGTLSRAELFVFFKKGLMYKPSSAELDEIFKIVDTDGDGSVSLVEFLKLFGKSGEEAKSIAAEVTSPRRAPRVPLPKLPLIRRKFGEAGKTPAPKPSQQRHQNRHDERHEVDSHEVALLSMPVPTPHDDRTSGSSKPTDGDQFNMDDLL
jgi:hypothetical protein